MAQVLIAVTTCEKNRERADACRAAWARFIGPFFDVRFFVGLDKSYGEPREFGDTVVLPCADDYLSLPAKVKETMIWSTDKGYEFTYKVDDDTFLIPERLQAAHELIHRKHDYVGNMRQSQVSEKWYASGFCYGLSRKAAKTIATAAFTGDTNEDRWVGSSLYAEDYKERFTSFDEKRFICCENVDPAFLFAGQSRIGKTHIAYAQYDPKKMLELRKNYQRLYVGFQ